MGRIIDKICVIISVFIISVIFALMLTKQIAVSIFIALSITIIASLAIIKIGKTKCKGTLSLAKFDTYMIVKGMSYQLDLLSKLYDNSKRLGNAIIYDNYLICPIYKFGNISRDDIIKVRNIAIDSSIETAYIISNNLDRSSISFSNLLYDINFKFIKSKELYKLLKSKNLIPKMPDKIKHNKVRIKDLLSLMIARENAKRFLFSAFILLIIGIITPFRTYYLTLSMISCILCLISILGKDRLINNNNLPIIKNKDLP